ncbi:MAG: anthranilate synthase component I [Candidatus Omnitrophota bacterium]|nr:anthranilate synthase component I [Candidatus Omnitrophota bacterium]
MISPSSREFRKLLSKGNIIAITRTIPADLETPVSAFLKVSKKSPEAFLLESAEYADQIGRYSFIGVEPLSRVESYRGDVKLSSEGRKQIFKNTKLLKVLKSCVKELRPANPQAVPGFCGGFVGYFSYENVVDFEDVSLKSTGGPDLPEAIFFLPRDLLVFDHFRKLLTIAVFVKVDLKRGMTTRYEEAVRRISRLIQSLGRPLEETRRGAKAVGTGRLKSNMTQGAFEKKVKRVKEYIRAGDCIQVVLSQRFEFSIPADDFKIYRSLRCINPSPYMFYFRSGKVRLIGSSPEVLVRKKGRNAEVRPIAGTRPRGMTGPEDARYEESLRKSPKELAEHLMLVDLGRNDLGRVCEFESVRVADYARVERFSHVMHLVSDVVGKLARGKDAFDLLESTFPAGTVTGAPKIRAMQIIDELEGEKRGPYAGSVGYFALNQDMDMCITIRTLVVNGNRGYLQAGAGIVKDSSPSREYQETVNKASAVLKAIRDQETI